MESKPNEQQEARALYFQTEMSQKEIAQRTGINRKTLYTWIKEGHWMRARRSVASLPIFLAEQYYSQLANINKAIAEREDRPYPTREESEIIRKLCITLKHLPANNLASNAIDVFTLFIDKVQRADDALAKAIIPHMDNHVQYLYQRSQGDTVLKDIYAEDADDRQYKEYLREQEQQTQQSNTQTPTDTSTDNKTHSATAPAPSERAGVRPSPSVDQTHSATSPSPSEIVGERSSPPPAPTHPQPIVEAKRADERSNGVTDVTTPERLKPTPDMIYMRMRQKEITGRGFPNGVRTRRYTEEEMKAEVDELNRDPRYVKGEKEAREMERHQYLLDQKRLSL